jgi:hypothetical protein
MSAFIAGLILSGVTAFPLLYELSWLTELAGIEPDVDYRDLSGLQYWLAFVHEGLRETYRDYPFIGYGTDWLAFGHIVIALFFVGPLRRPGEYEWTLIVGIIACILVIPMAFICGSIREIPVCWRLIDCAFGVIGMLPLMYCFAAGRRVQAEIAGRD